MTKSQDKNKFGVPRPFRSTDLASPSQIISIAINPLKLYHITALLILGICISFVITETLYELSNTVNSLAISLGILIISLVLNIYKTEASEKKSVRSIRRVSMMDDYMKSASRLFVVSIFMVLFGAVFSAILHVFDFVSITDATRFAILLSFSVGIVFSYTIVQTIYSYTPYFSSGFSSIPVKASSIPETVTFVGFVLPPILVSVTAFIYDGPSYVTLPFSFPVYDMLILILSILVLYISVLSRIDIR